ncbi:MAG: hypothetical protein R2685_17225 [Candidatus Nitrosocosmicus sp.]|nr:hypothetical protein [Candidatus Nitrosocosmicus sp.]
MPAKIFISLSKVIASIYELSCNGICVRYKAKRNSDIPSRYKEGQKRCSICEIFIKWDENPYCPCCNYKLRTRSFRGWKMRTKKRELTVKRY